MKRSVMVVVGVCFILFCGTQAHAWFGKKKDSGDQQAQQQDQQQASKPAASPAKKEQPKKLDKDAQAKLDAKKQLVEKKRKELDDTEWQIELTPLSGKGKKEGETVVFKGNQVSLTGYGKKGFLPTNFTLTVQEDGSAVWETMQTSEKSGIAFWRGEMADAQTMRGIFSYHPDEKTTVDYSFISTAKKSTAGK